MDVREATQLKVEFDPNQLFSYAQIIITAMMPVLYITLGLGLGFMVVRALKSAVQ